MSMKSRLHSIKVEKYIYRFRSTNPQLLKDQVKTDKYQTEKNQFESQYRFSKTQENLRQSNQANGSGELGQEKTPKDWVQGKIKLLTSSANNNEVTGWRVPPTSVETPGGRTATGAIIKCRPLSLRQKERRDVKKATSGAPPFYFPMTYLRLRRAANSTLTRNAKVSNRDGSALSQ